MGRTSGAGQPAPKTALLIRHGRPGAGPGSRFTGSDSSLSAPGAGSRRKQMLLWNFWILTHITRLKNHLKSPQI